jgi:hypothetical protein
VQRRCVYPRRGARKPSSAWVNLRRFIGSKLSPSAVRVGRFRGN